VTRMVQRREHKDAIINDYDSSMLLYTVLHSRDYRRNEKFSSQNITARTIRFH
jgi:hypothetical protein